MPAAPTILPRLSEMLEKYLSAERNCLAVCRQLVHDVVSRELPVRIAYETDYESSLLEHIEDDNEEVAA